MSNDSTSIAHHTAWFPLEDDRDFAPVFATHGRIVGDSLYTVAALDHWEWARYSLTTGEKIEAGFTTTIPRLNAILR